VKPLCLALLILFSPVFARTADNWPIFRGNTVLNGVSHSRFNPPLKLLWSYKTGDEIRSSPVVADNKVFVGSMDGHIYALDLSGKLLWKFKTETSVEASPIVIKKTVVAGSQSGVVYALDHRSGELKWSFRTQGQIVGSANWFTDGLGLRVLVASHDFNLYCLDLESGNLIWTCETGNYLNGTPATDNRRVVIGGCDSYLHIIDARGKVLAQLEIGTYVAESAAISGNLAYVGDYDGGFTCVDLVGMKQQWRFDNPRILPFLSAPAVNDKLVVIGSHDKRVYCFDKFSGELLWTYQAYGKFESSAVLIGNRVLICSDDGIIHLLAAETGKALYTYELGLPIKSTPALIDGLMIIGAKDGGLYAFETGP